MSCTIGTDKPCCTKLLNPANSPGSAAKNGQTQGPGSVKVRCARAQFIQYFVSHPCTVTDTACLSPHPESEDDTIQYGIIGAGAGRPRAFSIIPGERLVRVPQLIPTKRIPSFNGRRREKGVLIGGRESDLRVDDLPNVGAVAVTVLHRV